MATVRFILGGARSGKSTYALTRAREYGERVAFIATAEAHDEEMRLRIDRHIKERPGSWQTFEEPLYPADCARKIGDGFDVLIVDCLTLLVSNMMGEGLTDEQALTHVQELLQALAECPVPSIVVSNEVGLGIVPDNALARRFRDLAGRINQMAAARADEVVFMVSGLPMILKGGGR